MKKTSVFFVSMLAALLMYPETVIALLRMVVQVIHSAGEQLW